MIELQNKFCHFALFFTCSMTCCCKIPNIHYKLLIIVIIILSADKIPTICSYSYHWHYIEYSVLTNCLLPCLLSLSLSLSLSQLFCLSVTTVVVIILPLGGIYSRTGIIQNGYSMELTGEKWRWALNRNEMLLYYSIVHLVENFSFTVLEC